MVEKESEILIEELVKKYEDSIQNAENKQELVNGLRNYLNEVKKVVEQSKYDLTIEEALKASTKKIMELSPIRQEQKLIPDEKFNEIQKISTEVYESARKIISGNTEKVEIVKLDKMKETMECNLPQVKSFNRKIAESLVSEGLLDIAFIENPKIENTSLRIAKFKIAKNKII